MSDGEMTEALKRIDRALARIEAVADIAATPPAPIIGDPALVERHERLRGRVRETLDRIDVLIAGSEA